MSFESSFAKSRITWFFFALIMLYGILMIVSTITFTYFMPVVEDRGWTQVGFVDEETARTGIAFVIGFAIFVYSSLAIYGFLYSGGKR